MLQSPLYIDIKCTTVGSPRASHWVSISADTPAGGWRVPRQFWDTRGANPASETNGVTVRGLTRAPVLERRWSNVFSRSQGRRRLRKARDARSGADSSQPRAGGQRGSARGPARLSLPLCPRGKGSTVCGMKSVGRHGEKVGRSLRQGGLIKKCLFSAPPPQGSGVSIQGGGCPVWCCLKGSLRCRARH